MTKYIFIAIIFINLSPQVYSCDCNPISKEKGVELSKYILIGNILNVNSQGFQVVSKEIFKGNEVNLGDTLNITLNSCSIYPMKDEDWLLYIEEDESQYIVSTCNFSRNLSNPTSIAIPPMFPPFNYSQESSIMINIIEKQKILQELNIDLLTLRINKYLNQKDSPAIKKISIESMWLYVLVVINVLLIIISIILLVRKRR